VYYVYYCLWCRYWRGFHAENGWRSITWLDNAVHGNAIRAWKSSVGRGSSKSQSADRSSIQRYRTHSSERSARRQWTTAGDQTTLPHSRWVCLRRRRHCSAWPPYVLAVATSSVNFVCYKLVFDNVACDFFRQNILIGTDRCSASQSSVILSAHLFTGLPFGRTPLMWPWSSTSMWGYLLEFILATCYQRRETAVNTCVFMDISLPSQSVIISFTKSSFASFCI